MRLLSIVALVFARVVDAAPASEAAPLDTPPSEVEWVAVTRTTERCYNLSFRASLVSLAPGKSVAVNLAAGGSKASPHSG